MSMKKKLDIAKQEGYGIGVSAATEKLQEQIKSAFLEGVKVGAEAANEAWVTAMQNTKGVGPATMEKIHNQVKTEYEQRKAERQGLQKQAV